jgi:hypothetical protein
LLTRSHTKQTLATHSPPAPLIELRAVGKTFRIADERLAEHTAAAKELSLLQET